MDLSTRVLDPVRTRQLGTSLLSKFLTYETDRRLAELKWARNARQRLGIYDPDIESKLDPTKSRSYPKLTRVKCVSMLSRLMNLLFQDSDKPWAIEPSPVPNLDQSDLAPLLQIIDQKAQADGGRQPTDEEIEQAIRELAMKRAARLELEIEDQLSELGGNRTMNYVALCRKVLQSGIDYGMGVLEGPFLEDQKQRRWKRDAKGLLVPETFTAERPRFDFVAIWDYYPDMSAKGFPAMDGQYVRRVMSRAQVVKLKQRKDFIASQVDEALARFTRGNYKRRAYETELKAMGVQVNVSDNERGKFEMLIWTGNLTGQELIATGAVVPEKYRNDTVRATVAFIDDIVVKAEVEPWVVLAEDEPPQVFHHFVFEEDESTLLGNGLPNIVRDSQMGVCASARMALDNAAIAGSINLEVNTELLSLNQDITSIQPYKIWYREDINPATMQYPIVREIKFDSKVDQLKGLGEWFQGFADQETFVGPATGGDMQKGPSEPFRTAAGASMLRGDAALPFKDVVRNFDAFTISVVGSLITFNKIFNKNPQLRGDFQPIARGATSLIAKEVLGIQLDNLAQTMTPEEKMYIDMRKLARARVRARDLDHTDVVVNDTEADRREQAEQQSRQQSQDQAQRMAEAQIKEVLAGVLKDLAQAGKNASLAEATTANVILSAMEKGLSPNAIRSQIARGGVSSIDPSAVAGAGGQGDAGAGGVAPAGGVPALPGDAQGGSAPAPGGGPGLGGAIPAAPAA